MLAGPGAAPPGSNPTSGGRREHPAARDERPRLDDPAESDTLYRGPLAETDSQAALHASARCRERRGGPRRSRQLCTSTVSSRFPTTCSTTSTAHGCGSR